MCQSGTTAHRLSGANLIHPDDRTRASEAFGIDSLGDLQHMTRVLQREVESSYRPARPK